MSSVCFYSQSNGRCPTSQNLDTTSFVGRTIKNLKSEGRSDLCSLFKRAMAYLLVGLLTILTFGGQTAHNAYHVLKGVKEAPSQVVEVEEDKTPKLNEVGISNGGNSCYINSALQVLFSSDEVRAKLEADVFDEEYKYLFRPLKAIYEKMKSSKNSDDVKDKVVAFRKVLFANQNSLATQFGPECKLTHLTQFGDAHIVMRIVFATLDMRFKGPAVGTREEGSRSLQQVILDSKKNIHSLPTHVCINYERVGSPRKKEKIEMSSIVDLSAWGVDEGRYRLVGVVRHLGNHYVAAANRDGRWVNFNDNVVSDQASVVKETIEDGTYFLLEKISVGERSS